MELNAYYNDRGVKKYNGFYLSEHTATLDKERNNRYATIAGKDEMSPEQLYEVIDYALFKSKEVSIQLNMKDIEGDFLPDVCGVIDGYDEVNLYVNQVAVPFNQIRHAMLLETKTWY